MSDTNPSVNKEKTLNKAKSLNLPKIRFYQSRAPRQCDIRRVTGNATRHNLTHNPRRHEVQTIPECIENTETEVEQNTPRENVELKCTQKKELVTIKQIHLPYPSSLCSRGSMTSSPEKRLRPRSFKNFWTGHPESLEVQSLVLTRDIDALSIEIVRMYNEPSIALPKLDMGPTK